MNLEVCDVKDVVNHEKESQNVCKWKVLKFGICFEERSEHSSPPKGFKVAGGVHMVFRTQACYTETE